MSCPAVASENGTTLVRVRRKNQSNYSSLVLFGVTVKNYTEHGFSALASLIIVGFSPLSVKRIYARARRIHSVSSRSIPGHGGSTQCEADLRPGTVDPLSVKQIYALAQWIHSVSSRSTPWHSGSTQCQADLHPGTEPPPLSPKRVARAARNSCRSSSATAAATSGVTGFCSNWSNQRTRPPSDPVIGKGAHSCLSSANENHVVPTSAGKLQSAVSTSGHGNKEACLSVCVVLFTVSILNDEQNFRTFFFFWWGGGGGGYRPETESELATIKRVKWALCRL